MASTSATRSMVPELLKQVPSDQDIGSVTADEVYDTRKCHDAIAKRNAHAVIPPRKNAKPWKPTREPSRGGIKIPGPHPVAAIEWLSPPKPRRDQDALCETTGPEPNGAGLRPVGRGDPNPHRRAKLLHSSWYPCRSPARLWCDRCKLERIGFKRRSRAACSAPLAFVVGVRFLENMA